MKRSLLHTPEGVRDIYNEECAQKLALQENLLAVLRRYGYAVIQTPTFEFFDIFSREIGTTPSKDLYKFFDREGNTLVLRPDITPSIARAVTKYFSDEEMPIRLCYLGNTFINNSSYQGRLKECTQLGAELIGDDSVDADAEVLSLVVKGLKAAGLKEFQVTVGHVGILKGLEREAGLSPETTEELEQLIANKNFFGVDELVGSLPIADALKELFGCLGVIYDGAEPLSHVRELAEGYPEIAAALDRLIQLYEVLTYYKVEPYVSIELGTISDHKYYTGIIFSGYTFGSGEPVVKGGRYDDLLPYFGKQSPSIGFAVVIDQLMAALSRQKIQIEVPKSCSLMVYRPDARREAIEKAMLMRSQGEEVLLACWEDGKTQEDYESYAERFHCVNTIFL